jgi:hypothetical protein
MAHRPLSVEGWIVSVHRSMDPATLPAHFSPALLVQAVQEEATVRGRGSMQRRFKAVIAHPGSSQELCQSSPLAGLPRDGGRESPLEVTTTMTTPGTPAVTGWVMAPGTTTNGTGDAAEWVTVTTAMTLKSVSRRTVRRWVAAGLVESRLVEENGRQVRLIRRDTLPTGDDRETTRGHGTVTGTVTTPGTVTVPAGVTAGMTAVWRSSSLPRVLRSPSCARSSRPGPRPRNGPAPRPRSHALPGWAARTLAL